MQINNPIVTRKCLNSTTFVSISHKSNEARFFKLQPIIAINSGNKNNLTL
jgi:hypothetical protein